jgi:hypothetical protein
MSKSIDDLFWSNFFQFSYNSYSDFVPEGGHHNPENPELSHAPQLRWDQHLWEDLTKQIVDAGGNQVIFSLGDGIRYDSHPEIAVDGAWTPGEMKAEIQRLKALGLTLVPKLNFSTGHDLWLGGYHRMVSTPVYYEVCSDLIAEVIDIFDNLPYFHLGYDEETWYHQTWYEYVVLRQHDLWWRDFLWFVDQVESRGSRPWIWSDYIWDHTDRFLDLTPKSVIRSNWYYRENFDLGFERQTLAEKGVDLDEPPGDRRTQTGSLYAYLDLESGQYDQVPAGSIDVCETNFPDTIPFVQQHIPASRVLGFMQTTWHPMLEPFRDRFELGIEKFAEGRQRLDSDGWAVFD